MRACSHEKAVRGIASTVPAFCEIDPEEISDAWYRRRILCAQKSKI